MKDRLLTYFPLSWLGPTSKDPRTAQEQRLLLEISFVLCTASLGGFFAGLFLAFNQRAPVLLPVFFAVSGVVSAFALWLSRAGKSRLASMLVPAVLLGMSIWVNLYSGQNQIALIGYALAAIAGSMLVHDLAGLAAAILGSLAYILLGKLQVQTGSTSTSVLFNTPVGETLWAGGLLLLIVIFLFIYRKENGSALESQRAAVEKLARNRKDLELGISQQTAILDRRLIQIRTSAEIIRSMAGMLETGDLLQQVTNLIRDRFLLYYVGVFLIDDRNEYAVLKAGTGDAGQKMVAEGHKLAVGGSSMIGWCISNKSARIALEAEKDFIRYPNPYLWRTRSELAIPILSKDRVLGAITVQSEQEHAFDEDDITVLTVIADSLANTLENVRLIGQVQANLDEIQGLHHQYLARAWTEVQRRSSGDLEHTYEDPLAPEPTSSSATSTGSSIVVPLILRDQQIGELVIEKEIEKLMPGEQVLVNEVLMQAALALENARLLQETMSLAERERTAAVISSRLWVSPNIETILSNALNDLGSSLRASQGFIRLETSGAQAQGLPEMAGSRRGVSNEDLRQGRTE
jgi:GAF domain-containing protein